MSVNRERLLELIRENSTAFAEIAERYAAMQSIAERPESTDQFIELIASAGELTRATMSHYGKLLELLLFNIDRSSN